jgi:hypothetical protein
MTSDTVTPKYLTRVNAAYYVTKKWGINLSPLTLDSHASKGSGPAYRKHGRRSYYETSDLDDWVIKGISQKLWSTSAEAASKRPSDDDDNETKR